MKRLLLLLLLAPLALRAQSPVTVSGTVYDAGNNPATSGTVTFSIQPQSSSIHYYVPGVTAVAPQQTVCAIQSNGSLMNFNSSGPCTVWGNDVIAPANTTYTVSFAPNQYPTNEVAQECITGTAYNISTPKFCTVVSIIPQYSQITGPVIQGNLIPLVANAFTLGNAQGYYAQGFINNVWTNITGSATQCVEATAGGLLVGSGSASCGTGGVGPGEIPEIPFYSTTTGIVGDPYFVDNAANTAGVGALGYTGNGALFSTSGGGTYGFESSGTGGSSSQSEFGVALSESGTVVSGDSANFLFTSTDAGANNTSADFAIVLVSNGTNSGSIDITTDAAGVGSGDIEISASNPSSTSDGNIETDSTGTTELDSGKDFSIYPGGNALISPSGSITLDTSTLIVPGISSGSCSFLLGVDGSNTVNRQPCAGTAYYQYLSNGISDAPQESTIEFYPNFTITDTPLNNSTTVALNAQSSAGSYSCPSMTVDAYGIVTAASSNPCNSSSAVTITPGSLQGITSAGCMSGITCTATAGVVTFVGTSITAGTMFTVSFAAQAGVQGCTFAQVAGTSVYAAMQPYIDSFTTTGFQFDLLGTIAPNTYEISYHCDF